MNKIDRDIWNNNSLNVFKLSFLNFVRPVTNNSIFEINNPYCLKWLTKLPSGSSHLRYHKFRQNFQYCSNPVCVCGLEIEATSHFVPRCPLFQSARQSLLINVTKLKETWQTYYKNNSDWRWQIWFVVYSVFNIFNTWTHCFSWKLVIHWYKFGVVNTHFSAIILL